MLRIVRMLATACRRQPGANAFRAAPAPVSILDPENIEPEMRHLKELRQAMLEYEVQLQVYKRVVALVPKPLSPGEDKWIMLIIGKELEKCEKTEDALIHQLKGLDTSKGYEIPLKEPYEEHFYAVFINPNPNDSINVGKSQEKVTKDKETIPSLVVAKIKAAAETLPPLHGGASSGTVYAYGRKRRVYVKVNGVFKPVVA